MFDVNVLMRASGEGSNTFGCSSRSPRGLGYPKRCNAPEQKYRPECGRGSRIIGNWLRAVLVSQGDGGDHLT